MTNHIAVQTHLGKRMRNEDNSAYDLERQIFIVADGMGGHEGGDIASQIVVDGLINQLGQNDSNHTETSIRSALMEVHKQIEDHSIEMGSTVVLACLHNNQMTIAHVGDSRLYRMRDNTLSCLTRDHSLYEMFLETGKEDLPAREDFVYKNIITQALGCKQNVDVLGDVATVDVKPGDLYLLCTDGLYDPLGDEAIAQYLGQSSNDLKLVLNAMVQHVVDVEGSDNITGMIFRIK